MESCKVCEFERKNVWPGLVGHPSLKQEVSHPQSYLYSLFRCLNCEQLWCHYAYEPYSSFPYLVKWPETIEKFKNTKIEKILRTFKREKKITLLVLSLVALKVKMPREQFEDVKKIIDGQLIDSIQNGSDIQVRGILINLIKYHCN